MNHVSIEIKRAPFFNYCIRGFFTFQAEKVPQVLHDCLWKPKRLGSDT